MTVNLMTPLFSANTTIYAPCLMHDDGLSTLLDDGPKAN